MRYRLPIALTMLLAACGESGPPDSVSYAGAWQLTSVNALPLPVPGNAVSGVWVAGILQLNQQTGSYDWCLENASTSTHTDVTNYVVLEPISGDRVKVSYFDRREPVPDTAAVNGSQLSLRYRSVSVGGQVGGVDVMTFVPLTGDVPAACSLAP
jgi:hypothetical protein